MFMSDRIPFSISVFFLGTIFLAMVSCNQPSMESGTEIEVDLSTYQVKDGYQIQSVAAEPQVVAPVNMIFDDQGRMWVIEMIGYMTDYAGSEEDLPKGVISILEDRDGNGVADHKKIFLDGLVMPRAIAFANDGLLYAEPPALWWVPIEKDDRPGERVLVDSAYTVGGNAEHQPNGLVYNMDNWVYNSEGNARYRYRNRKWEKEYIFSRGQWGLTQDDYGILYYNNNSNQFQGDYFLPGLLDQNKNLAYPPGVSRNIVTDQSVYPLQFTAVNRGYVKGVLDSVTHKLLDFTSASGPLVYTGDQYDGAFENNSFVGGPEANFIKRNKIDREGIETTGEQVYKDSEFIISSDQAFRPVILQTGPDGLIYIVDMHRGIIQHKTYLTNYLREQYQEEGLDTILDMGRILRLLPEGGVSKGIPVVQNDELVDLLQHPNSWQRLYAQRGIVEQQSTDLIGPLKVLLSKTDAASYVPIHAFWALEGLGALDKEMVLDFAVQRDGYYLPHAVKYLSTEHSRWMKDLKQRIGKDESLLSEKNLIYWAAATLHLSGGAGEEVDFLIHILDRLSPQNKKYALYMALSQYFDHEEDLLQPLRNSPGIDRDIVSLVEDVTEKIEGNKEYYSRKRSKVSRNSGLEIFESNCASCHGRDGKGLENVAPPLYHSQYLEDADSALVMIVLHGLQGPVEVDGETYEFPGMMPALVDNPEYSDQKIAAVLSFVKNAFSRNPRGVSSRLVKELRDYPSEDGEPYTVQSLEERLKGINND